MTINGQNYNLTKHGRRRFLERVDGSATDAEILTRSVDLPEAVWKPDRRLGTAIMRLITVRPLGVS